MPLAAPTLGGATMDTRAYGRKLSRSTALRGTAAVTLCGFLGSGLGVAHAESYETDEKPKAGACVEGYRMYRRVGLIVAGASIFGGIYMSNAFAASFGVPNLAIPVFGPIVEAASARSSPGVTYLAVLDTLVQAGSLAMFIAGLVPTKRGLAYRELQVSVAPSLAPGHVGLFAMGRF